MKPASIRKNKVSQAITELKRLAQDNGIAIYAAFSAITKMEQLLRDESSELRAVTKRAVEEKDEDALSSLLEKYVGIYDRYVTEYDCKAIENLPEDEFTAYSLCEFVAVHDVPDPVVRSVMMRRHRTFCGTVLCYIYSMIYKNGMDAAEFARSAAYERFVFGPFGRRIGHPPRRSRHVRLEKRLPR